MCISQLFVFFILFLLPETPSDLPPLHQLSAQWSPEKARGGIIIIPFFSCLIPEVSKDIYKLEQKGHKRHCEGKRKTFKRIRNSTEWDYVHSSMHTFSYWQVLQGNCSVALSWPASYMRRDTWSCPSRRQNEPLLRKSRIILVLRQERHLLLGFS